MLGPDAEFVIGPLLFGPFGNQNGGLCSLPSLIVPAANMRREFLILHSYVALLNAIWDVSLKYFILTIETYIVVLYPISVNQTDALLA